MDAETYNKIIAAIQNIGETGATIEKIFSRILADMPEGVLILEFDYNILFMNRYLTARYGDCIGQKYFHVFFGSSQDPSRIAEVIDGKAEEVESCVEDKKGRILELKTIWAIYRFTTLIQRCLLVMLR